MSSSYIPPHRRSILHPASAHHPTPSSPPSRPLRAPYSSARHHPHNPPRMTARLQITWAQTKIRRFLVMLDNESSANAANLGFEPFDGDYVFAHLEDDDLYTLRVVTPPEGSKPLGNQEQQEVRDGGANDRLLMKLSWDEEPETTESPPWVSIVRRVQADLLTALEQLRSSFKIEKHSKVVPSMVLRFGRLVFNSNTKGGTRRSGIDCNEFFSPTELERACEGGFLSGKKIAKTFDTCNLLDFFHSLEPELAYEDSVQSVKHKDRYMIVVRDLQRQAALTCSCSVLNSSETESESKEKAQLVLKKVKLGAVRQMILDIACVEKKQDLRLALYTEEHLLHFSEEEREAIEWIVSTARIDRNVKGGLDWPGGCLDALSNRFEVSSCYQIRTALKEEKVKWKLYSFMTSKPFCVAVYPPIWSDYLKGKKQCNPEDIIQSVTDILEFAWTQCI